MPKRMVSARRWKVIAAFVLLAASYIVGIWLVTHLNNQRVDEIQASRLESCERGYEGIRQTLHQAFAPLVPKVDDPTTRRNEVRDAVVFFASLDKTIDRLKAGCANQISTKGD